VKFAVVLVVSEPSWKSLIEFEQYDVIHLPSASPPFPTTHVKQKQILTPMGIQYGIPRPTPTRTRVARRRNAGACTS
jgi:hypothetical protein